MHRRRLITIAASCATVFALPARAWAKSGSLLDFLPVDERDAIRDGTSTYDCGPAINKALRTVAALAIPEGRYVVATPVVIGFVGSGRFSPGVRIEGEGPGRTIIDDRSCGAALFDADCGADGATGFRAIQGVRLSGMTIRGERAGPDTSAVRLRGCFQSSIRDMHIIDRAGRGIHIPCLHGDLDGSNMVEIERVRIENCALWGIDAAAISGHNEISFLSLRHVFVQNCGTSSSKALPASGGMRYKGQQGKLESCAFTLNHNVGLFIPGENGLAIDTTLTATTFENNIGRHLYCTGTSNLRAQTLQFFNNDQFRATIACEFAAVEHVVRAVVIDGVTIRASRGNARYAAFRFAGANLSATSCRVSGIVWDDFGYPGQVRADGNASVFS